MLYGGGGADDDDDGVRGGGVGCDWWAERTDPVLDLASDSYSELEISVGDSGFSFCPTYTVYWLLLLLTTVFKETVYDFVLRRTFYSRQLL